MLVLMKSNNSAMSLKKKSLKPDNTLFNKAKKEINFTLSFKEILLLKRKKLMTNSPELSINTKMVNTSGSFLFFMISTDRPASRLLTESELLLSTEKPSKECWAISKIF